MSADQDGAAKIPAVDRDVRSSAMSGQARCQVKRDVRLSDRTCGEVDLIPPVAGHDRALIGGSVELVRVSERDCGDFVQAADIVVA
jgi:hypothetical protein